MTDLDRELWRKLTASVSYRELLREYAEALNLVEARVKQFPTPTDVPADVAAFAEMLVAAYKTVLRAAVDRSMLDQIAPQETVEIVLSVVRRIRLELEPQACEEHR